jgi:hypothetical protein
MLKKFQEKPLAAEILLEDMACPVTIGTFKQS